MLKFWLSPAGLMIVGLVAAVNGGVHYWKLSQTHLPERSELTKISGEIMSVNMVWMQSTKTGKTSDERYRISVKQDNGEMITLAAPMERAWLQGEENVGDAPIIALVDHDHGNLGNEIWDLTIGGRSVFSYDNAIKRASAALQGKIAYYLYFLGGGILAIGGGIVWSFARRRPAAPSI